jgi:hypothetical protein
LADRLGALLDFATAKEINGSVAEAKRQLFGRVGIDLIAVLPKLS